MGAGSLGARGQSVSATGESSKNDSDTIVETVREAKAEFLERNLSELRSLVSESAKRLNGGFVFLDDFYQLQRGDHPKVLGYMHRLIKDTGLWLKIGTLRNMTVTYKGDPPTGMQLRHDALAIELDRQFSNYDASKNFLEEILGQLCDKAGLKMDALFNEGSRDRLMLASGGVARDYLELAYAALEKARSRGRTPKSGSHRVTVEDVNSSAAKMAPSKMEDVKSDAPAEFSRLETRLSDLTEFCRSSGRAFFLVNTQDEKIGADVAQMQNLRLVNLVTESETVRNLPGRFNVWLLDVSMLAHQRADQSVSFDGWQKRDQRRQAKYVYTDEWRTRKANGVLRETSTPTEVQTDAAHVEERLPFEELDG